MQQLPTRREALLMLLDHDRIGHEAWRSSPEAIHRACGDGSYRFTCMVRIPNAQLRSWPVPWYRCFALNRHR